MKVLLTGSHGYIGSITRPVLRGGRPRGGRARHALLPRLRLRDRRRRRRRACASTSATSTAAQLEGFDAVVHLAALSNDPLGDLRNEWTYDINLDGTVEVAKAAKDAGVGRFVFASSCSMYGASSSDDLLDETAPLRPLTPYAESKVRSEDALHELADADFSPVSMRNATAFGVSPRLRLDVVLNNLAAWAHTTGKIRLLSDGSAWRPLVHVRDIARATAERSSRRRATSCTTRRSTSARRSRTSASAISRTRCTDLLGCEVEIAGGARRTRGATASTSRSCARRSRTSAVSGTPSPARPSWSTHTPSVGLTYEEFIDVGRYTRLAQLRRLLEGGRLDDDLRWRS